MKEYYLANYPELFTLTTDLAMIDDPSFVLFPRVYVRNNWYFESEIKDKNEDNGYSVKEGNRCFSLDENPCFVNPTVGDYRVVEGSGAPDFRFELAGRY